MKRAALAGAVTGMALLAGCSTGFENVTSPNDPALQEAFTEVHDFWVQEGVGDIATTQLVSVKNPGDEFVCHNTKNQEYPDVLRSARDDTTARYCLGENTVAVIDHVYQEQLKSTAEHVSARSYTYRITAHEIGHAVAMASGERSPIQADNELRADCYGGEFIAKKHPELLKDITAQFDLEADSGTHGTAQERANAWRIGAKDSTGTQCKDLYHGSYLIQG